MRRFPWYFAVPVITMVHAAFAQAPTAFTVASIRPSQADAHARSHIYNSPDDANFKAVNVPLLALLRVAFALPETQIVGGPPALLAQKFDLDAKGDAELDAHMHALPPAEARAQKASMLQALLAERFGLLSHPETRELPEFALVVARGGPKLPDSKNNGTQLDTSRDHMSLQGVPLATLAEELSKVTGRVVVDRTALAGRYNIALRWQPDDALATTDASAPSLLVALEEQLGLKLESTHGPVPVVVIDHLNAPSAN